MVKISEIKKRDGRIVKFDQEKITIAIYKALIAVKTGDIDVAKDLSDKVVKILEENFAGKVPSVEDVQDIVEKVLINSGYAEAAKAYILYRQKRTEIREAKKFLGVIDDLKLTLNAINVLQKRYLLKDKDGKIIETPKQMFRRVARAVAKADLIYNKKANIQEIEEEFYKMMENLEFLPNSPCLMNAGTEIGQLSACFVLPVEDSIESIFDAVKNMALIQKSGGGTGFSFSRLRPSGDIVGSTMGVASGPVSFMRIFDTATDVIKQGGKRRGANMGILSVHHPDIVEFITSKEKEGVLTNFNISVAVTDKFMEAVKKNEEYELINPRTNEVTEKMNARDVFNLIVTTAWKTGDPGLIFIDEINRHNPTPQIGKIEATNPCGEQPLLPYESCNLGSINLARMVENGKINWEKLRKTVRSAVHFLDNVIDVNKFPLPEIEKMTKANRKIGLGVMGFADMLIELGIPYNSEDGIKIAEEVMKFITAEARKKSVELAAERGSFPNFKGSKWEKDGYKQMRNATVTTIAPTGTISIIAGCSSGIEPLFAISFIRNVMEGTTLMEVNQSFEKIAKERGFYSSELMMEIAKKGSIQSIENIPADVKRIFVTAFDITPEWHVRMQAAFQKYTDNAVSKTVNLPNDATIGDVEKVFWLAYELKCKGITIYRYGSKKEQVLYVTPVPKKKVLESYVTLETDESGGCPKSSCQV
ncbi:MAG: vitamin B12-dependent ribonucleotide reductase [Candidatus Parvarchaeota archaeon]|nr:vitamin B12-dependent ribonucleotide reductase [Candidatus Jingweiarchaeum tengchongense]MCW1298645.1 vitamin B12-dependent ribonucleotide reductase [Candidatus Jingweiarchaeum tengchongense]MCW1300487.1 vitamin B12-dependent ribonucleotide reductase [Candidatus Jingweiarchaeum tengchongense]MCW1304698.1 vitamin B12-dependent ribonucleotide reductase [Candidatus Jingweiarchaeum tengchongense]MCW1305887.1 vitamin B12-dependent ribonucleotide reductase [Candidatus Jingweiarchaeum tengchongense